MSAEPPPPDPASPDGNSPPKQDGAVHDAVNALFLKHYDELRAMAARFMAHERAGQTLQATALVHESYQRLLDQRNLVGPHRVSFLAAAAGTMRRILIDRARSKRATKRGGGTGHRVDLTTMDLPDGHAVPALDLLALHELLEQMVAFAPRAAELVELRFFGGLTVDEAATALDISPRTAAQEWAVARAFLLAQLQEPEA